MYETVDVGEEKATSVSSLVSFPYAQHSCCAVADPTAPVSSFLSLPVHLVFVFCNIAGYGERSVLYSITQACVNKLEHRNI